MATPIEILASYAPAILLRRLASGRTTGPMLDLDRHESAVFFVDISGFTRLSEELGNRGPDGLDQLTGVLNAYFDRLIELIASHGGDVVKMAGDALIALWPTGLGGDSLAEATLRAAGCGLVVQSTLRDYEVAEGIRLTSRVAIAAGLVAVMQVGGRLNRWEMLLSGDPLTQMGRAEKLASPGEVVLAPEAWGLTRSRCRGQPIDGGFLRLEAIDRPLPPRPLDAPVPGPESEAALRAYVPGAIRARLVAGQTAWLAELRRLSVLFVHLPTHDLDRPDALERTQEIITTLQASLYRHEGSVNKLSIDEKGTTLVAAMGLPPLAHEDDARLAIEAGQAMREALAGLGLACSIGIATGRVYCGEVGNERRREYTIIGRVVNLAARLMQAALAEHDILCDEATYRATRDQFDFLERPALRLKNIEHPVVSYRPLGRNATPGGPRSTIGRLVERTMIAARLDALVRGQGMVLFIEGEAGIGKSRLVNDAIEQAEVRGVALLAGGGDAIDRSTPYHAWRPLFASLLGDDPEVRAARVVALLGDDPEPGRLAPLLRAVLPVALPENDLTRQMAGQVRADNTTALLVALLRGGLRAGPTLVIVEDAHWLDSASWALLQSAVRSLDDVLFLVTARPGTGAFPDEFPRLLAVPDARHLRLEALADADALGLVRDRLGVDSLPPRAAELILQKAQGNPFFCEELAFAMRDSGLLVVEGRRCRVAPGIDLATVSIPDQVEGVINGRVDRLSPPEQLALKVASIIGRMFAVRLLRDVYPIEPDRDEIPARLDSLARLELILPDEPEPDVGYLFRHVITRDVVYDRMPFSQRRRLHAAVAGWYETTRGDDLSPYYALLAHHWGRADDAPRTADYLEKAGEQAIRGGSYREAIGFFGEALTLLDRDRPGSEPGRRARWEARLGEAHLSTGNLVAGRTHAERALALLGRPVPGRMGLVPGLAVELARQAIRRRGTPGLDDLAAGDARLASSAFGLMGQFCYFDQEKGLGVYSALRALNLAEEDARPSTELARALATMCMACGLVPVHRLARHYGRRALDVASGLDDRPTRAWVLQLTGMYDLGVGGWDDCRRKLEEAVAISRGLGDWRRWEESSGELARLDYYVGAFEAGAARFGEFGEEAKRRGHVQAHAWGLHGRAKLLLRLARFEEAAALLDESRTLPPEAIGIGDAILRSGLLAHLHRSLGNRPAARRAAEETARLVKESPPIVSYTLEGYSGAAQAMLDLWEHSPRPSSSTIHAARRAVSALRRIARVFPVGRPRALLCLGTALWLSGRRSPARRAWRSSLGAAESLGMPYERALILREIGRHLDRQDHARRDHLDRARSIFLSLGSTFEAAACDD